ncbi:MAG: F420-dependent glucose-6-phosphate dehydrogenase Fgd2 [Rubrobacteraceae bacterium]|nr:F420-dependent glucose-6-phosphate dehydrogenase Fgd2 [Rubrobacteraceae bacterium]
MMGTERRGGPASDRREADKLRRGRETLAGRHDGLRAAALGATAGEAGAPVASGGAATEQGETTPVSMESAAPGEESHENARFGFGLLHEQLSAQELIEHGVLAEQAGFDMVWTSDHFHPWQDNEGHSMFPWMTLALLGQRTSRVLLGTGVTCPIYRHPPSEVAQAFASLGIFYPGRVFLGVGTGEALNERAGTGTFGPYQERADRLVEAVQLIRRLWTGEPTSYDGAYYRTENARLYDVPERPIPIYVAASGPKSARLAGEHGDGWIGGAADIENKELQSAFREGAEAAGKDSESMPKIAALFVVVGGEEEAAYAADLWRFTVNPWDPDLLYDPDPRSIQRKAEEKYSLEDVYEGWSVGEDPEKHARRMQDVLDAGATRIFILSGQQDQRRLIDFYGSEVLPRLRPS